VQNKTDCQISTSASILFEGYCLARLNWPTVLHGVLQIRQSNIFSEFLFLSLHNLIRNITLPGFGRRQKSTTAFVVFLHKSPWIETQGHYTVLCWVLTDGRSAAAASPGKRSARWLAVGVAAVQREWAWCANAVGRPSTCIEGSISSHWLNSVLWVSKSVNSNYLKRIKSALRYCHRTGWTAWAF